jgi:hypothetical protein
MKKEFISRHPIYQNCESYLRLDLKCRYGLSYELKLEEFAQVF